MCRYCSRSSEHHDRAPGALEDEHHLLVGPRALQQVPDVLAPGKRPDAMLWIALMF